MERLLLLVLGPLVGAAIGLWIHGRWPQSRLPLITVLALSAAIVATAASLSFLYPGPAKNYTPDSFAWIVRERVIYPGGMVAFALPLLLSAATSLLASRTKTARRAIFVAGLVGAASVPIVLIVLLFTGCNYAGACL
ncbi:hypothetical protein [Lysobacter tyrosinilyticus]